MAISLVRAPFGDKGGLVHNAAAYADLDEALAAIGANPGVLSLPPGLTRTLTANLTIPANITLDPKGGVIDRNGYTLTINGPVLPHTYEFIADSGAGSTVDAGLGPLGTLLSPVAARTKRLEVLAGVIRQDATDKTKWFFLSDSDHAQLGFDTVFSSAEPYNLWANGGSLYVRYAKAYNRVITFIVTPDETLANTYGLTVGASVGTDVAILQARMNRQLAGLIYWDGTAWVTTMGTYQGGAPTVAHNTTTGVLTVTHNNGTTETEIAPGIGVSLVPYTVGNTVVPYVPVLHTQGNGLFTVGFMNPATGAIVTGAPDTRMAFYWSKMSSVVVRFDGAGDFALPMGVPANLWLYAVMEV